MWSKSSAFANGIPNVWNPEGVDSLKPNVPSRVVRPESMTATVTPPPALRLMSHACGMLITFMFHCCE